jgi:V8-like Glu-specific endopeptidase
MHCSLKTYRLYRPRVEELEDRSLLSAVQVNDPAAYPFSAIAKVISWYDINRNGTRDSGEVFVGSAAMCGARSALTAAHVVYNQSRGGFATQVEIIPGKNGDSEPFGRFMARSWVIPLLYRTATKPDIAVLNFSTNVGSLTGWLGFKSYSTESLRNGILNYAGYPSNPHDGQFQFRDDGQASSVTTSLIKYSNDVIETEPGSSGSAIYRYFPAGDKRYIVGVHVSKNSSTTPFINSATRLNSTLIEFIFDARQATGSGGKTLTLSINLGFVRIPGFFVEDQAAVLTVASTATPTESPVAVVLSVFPGAEGDEGDASPSSESGSAVVRGEPDVSSEARSGSEFATGSETEEPADDPWAVSETVIDHAFMQLDTSDLLEQGGQRVGEFSVTWTVLD